MALCISIIINNVQTSPFGVYTHTQYTIINLLANYKVSECESNLLMNIIMKSVRVGHMAISEGKLFHI